MNILEQIIHTAVGDYPFIRIPLVATYQRIRSFVPSKNFEVAELTTCLPGYFFGFHDKNPWSYDSSKLLSHRFDINKEFSQLEDSPIDVGYFENDKYHVIGVSNAWNWQQGSSLQWVGNTNKVIYNDIEHGKCVAQLIDLETATKKTIQCHIMAVSNNGRYAISCSFSRLGKGMPGYGYAHLRAAEKIKYPISPPYSGNLRAIFNHKILALAQLVLRFCSIKSLKSHPTRDAILGHFNFSATLIVDSDADYLSDNASLSIIDLENNTTQHIITIKEIINNVPYEFIDNAYHFFSHCLFSPDDNRFVIFHRYLRKNGVLETRMLSSELDGKNIWVFSGEKFSHIA